MDVALASDREQVIIVIIIPAYPMVLEPNSHVALKRYPHFDATLTVDEAVALVTDPERVLPHGF